MHGRGGIKMEVTRGTIFKNTYNPKYDTYLVYLYSWGSNSYCIKVCQNKFDIVDVDWNCRMYKHSLMNDRNHFPIVGHINLDNILLNHILNEISRTKKIHEEDSCG